MFLLSSMAFGCATVDPSMRLGIRNGYESVNAGRIAVLPFSLGFSLEREDRAQVKALYEQAVVEHLLALSGEAVLSPDDVSERLKSMGVDQVYRDRLDLDGSLAELFEESDAYSQAYLLERGTFLREIGETLNVDSVLMGEVLYMTEARCEAKRDSAYTQHVIVVGDLSDAVGSVPCVVSHVHVKLLDVREGRVMWYNRVLREVRVSMAGVELDATGNALASVGLLLESRGGLRRLLAP